MAVKLTKSFITKYLLPYLSRTHLGRPTKVPLWRMVNAMIYRLKTGCQWRELPLRQFCSGILTTWQSVYYHFNKWSKDGSWKQMWTKLLSLNKGCLDMSSTQLDGSHTPAKRGGEAVEYQGRKKCKTTNALFLTDKQGLIIAMSTPVSGNHHDVYDIKNTFEKMLLDVQAAGIETNGLFLNADAGFDCQELRDLCFQHGIIDNIDINKRNAQNAERDVLLDDLLYKDRFSVERTNAWIDAFKTLLVRFETKNRNWESWHYIAFAIILIRFKTKHF